MPVKIKIAEPDGTYFITFTCFQWLPLIGKTNSYDAVYKWFDYLKGKGHHIVGFVIMPNHIHALISFRDMQKSINTIVGNGKRFMAYAIIERLKLQGETKLLNILNQSVSITERLRNKKHELWERSFDWKQCISRKFMEQKLNYMHQNPCVEKWNLAHKPEDYIHSSAKYYIEGIHAFYPITNYLELDDIDFGSDIF